MKSNTTQILNEADDMERRLSWVLFKAEQEAMLYSGNEDEWSPGDPVYLPPELTVDYFQEPTEDEIVAYAHTQVYFNPPRCDDCGTYWKGEEPCFICGETRPIGFEFYPGNGRPVVRLQIDTEAFQESMRTIADRFAEGFRHSFAEAGRAFSEGFLSMTETRRLLSFSDAGMPAPLEFVRSNHDTPTAIDIPRDVPIVFYPGETRFDSRIEFPEDLDLDATPPVPMPVIDVFSMDSATEMTRLIERHHVEWRRERADGTPLTERRRDYGG